MNCGNYKGLQLFCRGVSPLTMSKKNSQWRSIIRGVNSHPHPKGSARKWKKRDNRKWTAEIIQGFRAVLSGSDNRQCPKTVDGGQLSGASIPPAPQSHDATFPPTFLPSPFSSPSPCPLPFPFPLPLEVGSLKSSYGVWGSTVSSPAGSGVEHIWCILALKWHLVATILIISWKSTDQIETLSSQLPYFCPHKDFCDAFCVTGVPLDARQLSINIQTTTIVNE